MISLLRYYQRKRSGTLFDQHGSLRLAQISKIFAAPLSPLNRLLLPPLCHLLYTVQKSTDRVLDIKEQRKQVYGAADCSLADEIS